MGRIVMESCDTQQATAEALDRLLEISHEFLSNPVKPIVRGVKRPPNQGSQDYDNVRINIVEWLTPSKAIIAWCDSTHCNYGAQIWQQSTARKNGVCALSGKQIFRGDVVYRPRGGMTYLNLSAMILSSAIVNADADEPDVCLVEAL